MVSLREGSPQAARVSLPRGSRLPPEQVTQGMGRQAEGTPSQDPAGRWDSITSTTFYWLEVRLSERVHMEGRGMSLRPSRKEVKERADIQGLLRKLHTASPYDPATPLLGMYPELGKQGPEQGLVLGFPKSKSRKPPKGAASR